MVKGHFATISFQPLDVSAPRHFGPRLFCVHHTQKLVKGIMVAETLIIILAEHNVPINFADHFTKLVLFVLEFYGPVNNEVMSSQSVNSGTVPGQT